MLTRVPYMVDGGAQCSPLFVPSKVDQCLPEIPSKYITILGLLAEGSFGKVSKGIKHGTEIVVLKEMKNFIESSFRKEGRLLKMLEGCPNIVRFHGVCTDYDNPSLVMEFLQYIYDIDGVKFSCNSLKDYLFQLDICYRNPFASLQMLDNYSKTHLTQIGLDIISAISFLHSKDIVHRDIKPANFLVANYNCPRNSIICKLTDFGESRARLVEDRSLSNNLDRLPTNSWLPASPHPDSYFVAPRIHEETQRIRRGTLCFMAPEQLLREHGASWSELVLMDIWQMGMTFFCLVNPDLPYPFYFELNAELQKQNSACWVDQRFQYQQVLQAMKNIMNEKLGLQMGVHSAMSNAHPAMSNVYLTPTMTIVPFAPTMTNVPLAPTMTNVPFAPTMTNVPLAPTMTNVPLAPTMTNVPLAPTMTNDCPKTTKVYVNQRCGPWRNIFDVYSVCTNGRPMEWLQNQKGSTTTNDLQQELGRYYSVLDSILRRQF